MTTIGDPPANNVEAADQVFRALTSAMRRRILLALLESSPRQKSELAGLAPNTNDRKLALAALYHQHFPHLDQAGFVDTGQDRNIIFRGDRFEEVKPVLRLLNDNRGEVPDQWAYSPQG